MSLYVKKFGGTSVASISHLENVASGIIKAKSFGHDVVVVVSAMGSETDRLDDLAREVDFYGPDARREIDVLLSTGEQVTTSLLSMVLMRMGCDARSYTGGQVRILTDSAHTRARIQDIDTEKLQQDLDSGVVPVVAGFQGVNEDGDITTFGRGGSDTTAVALAAVLNADECQIYTDVEGVFTTDPRVVADARCLKELTFEEILPNLFETSVWIDDGVRVLKQLTRLRVERQIFEEQHRLLGDELRTTTQRVNLFEKVKIPEAKEHIRVIRIFMGDKQTAAVARSKIAKGKSAEKAVSA